MRPNHRQSLRQFNHRSAGFTLLEVLVALVIVGTALGASLRAIGSLTQNSRYYHESTYYLFLYLIALQELLERRPQDVDAQTNIGITPLMMAATEGHIDAVKLLLKFGADLTIKGDDGMTAKEVAIKNGNEELVPLLS